MSIGLERDLFLEAIEIHPPELREQFLSEKCGSDEQLRNNVLNLLREHDRPNNPIDHPVFGGQDRPECDTTASELSSIFPRHRVGATVGPYKLMEQIGEGGFGLVFVADQDRPVRRRVALKIIKPGMESREVIARFEAERQAIAMMDHENIARVFDAGVTDTGQPYFAMELVRGVPLIEFCDNHKLETHKRLTLFVSICNAVQHAHQKGIIHRDLKPSNVLVTLQDGRPIPKVIDFGIVKAMGGLNLTDKTIYTRLASMMGTPAYMSPEQAEMSNVDVDTRSDIYSLGVMLYELLAGATPFTRERLNSVGFDELRRIIREEDPPRPSTRFSTLGHQLVTTISANRRLEPAKLTSLIKGDLDWIVMKALDKDRARRYPSAIAMAEDVSRFLMREPVQARPPSTAYRFSKFARRNKVTLATLGTIAFVLICGTAVSLYQTSVAINALTKARQAEADATASRDELERFTEKLKRANRLITSGRAYAEADDWSGAYRAYTTATEIQPRYFHVWMERAGLLARLGLWDQATSDYTRALELDVPIDGAEFFGVPQLLVMMGHREQHKQLVASLENHVDRRSWGTVLRGKLVSELSTSEINEIVDLGERLLIDETDHLGRKPLRSYMPMGARLYIAGWANFRAGNTDVAIEQLQRAHQEDLKWRGHGTSLPLLALAHHHAGQVDKANDVFEQTRQFLDRWLDESLEKYQGAPPMPWFDWIEFLINYEQASRQITGEAPFDDPRFNAQRELALQSIR